MAAAVADRDRGLLEARQALERVRAAQAAWRTGLQAERAQQAALDAVWLAMAETAARELVGADAAKADATFDRIVVELAGLGAALDDATRRARAPALAPRPLPQPPPTATASSGAEARLEMERVIAELNSAADALDDESAQLAIARAELTFRAVDRLNTVRIATLSQLSPGKRMGILRITEEDLAHLQREVQQAAVVARFLWHVEVPAARSHLSSLPSLTVTRLSVHTLLLLVVGASAAVLVHRGRRWLAFVRMMSLRLLGRRLASRWIGVAVAAIDAVWDPLVAVLAVLAAGVVVSPVLAFAAGALAYRVVLAWTVLRLLVQGVHEVIRWLARPQLGALGAERSDRAFTSVRFVGRFAFALSVFLSTTEAMVGRGILYTVAVRLGWLIAVPVALILIRRWQNDIATTYLLLVPAGRLAVAVTDTRTRWFGFFVVVAAFVFVASRAVVSVSSRFVLQFDQTRKALAFVFRRRLERRAREMPDDEQQPLPASVEEALRITPADPDDALPERLVELPECVARHARWLHDEGVVGAIAVVGHTGIGKTTWLRCFVAGLGASERSTASWVSLTERPADGPELCQRLALAVGGAASTVDELVLLLRAGPRRLLVIDDAHQLWLRGSLDRTTWHTFNAIIAAVGDHVFFVCAFDAWAWAHLRWAEPTGGRFRQVVTLGPWSEAEIHTLLVSRTALTAHEVLYDDLVIAKADVEDRELQLLTTAREYARLLWDFAEGSPATALDAWRRSLHPVHLKKHLLRVRLFPQPPDHVLDGLDATGRFALAAVMWNGVISAAQASRALRLPGADVKDALRRLREDGVLVENGGRYRLHVAWWSISSRFLRRKHLIAD